MIIIQNLAYILFGVLLLFVSSQLNIPMDPIPITLQTVGVMLIGLLFKRRHAIQTISLYLALGAIGMPVFANYHGGLQYLFGPTGGYLWGFLVAVIFMTSLKHQLDNSYTLHAFSNCLLGTVVILLCGVFWLAYYFGIKTAVKSGLYPFIIPGMLKVLLSTVIMRGVFHYMNHKKNIIIKSI